jgi:hypothetical protein
MSQLKNHHVHNAPVSLEGLNQKLDFESKRLVREREDGIMKRISKTAVLNGNSTLVFKDINGAKVMLSYRLDSSGALRFAREKRFAE